MLGLYFSRSDNYHWCINMEMITCPSRLRTVQVWISLIGAVEVAATSLSIAIQLLLGVLKYRSSFYPEIPTHGNDLEQKQFWAIWEIFPFEMLLATQLPNVKQIEGGGRGDRNAILKNKASGVCFRGARLVILSQKWYSKSMSVTWGYTERHNSCYIRGRPRQQPHG